MLRTSKRALKGFRILLSHKERWRVRTRILELFTDSIREPADCKKKERRHIAWGQFLERGKEKQYGLYGTSAGLQVLCRLDKSHSYVESAYAHLLEQFDDDKSRASSKSDFANTYKYCFFLDAIDPVSDVVTGSKHDRYFEGLIRQKHEGAGWGEYFFAGAETDPSKPLPTCMALLSLHRYKNFPHSDHAKTALGWLLSQTEAKLDSLNNEGHIEHYIILLSLYCVTLHKYKANQGNIIKEDVCKSVRKRLGTTAHRVYSLGVKAQHHFPFQDAEKYIYFETDLILLWALGETEMLFSHPIRAAGIYGYYLDRFDRYPGYVPPGFMRKFTVDHLWLLKAINVADRGGRRTPWKSLLAGVVAGFSLALVLFHFGLFVQAWENLILSIIGGLLTYWLTKKSGLG